MAMNVNIINFQEKFALFTEQWSPKIIAQMNDYHLKIAKIQGSFVWHSHPETDEVFIVISGKMRIDFRTGFVNLKEGEMVVVPKGVEHRPLAKEECFILMVEPIGTLNTGDSEGDRTIRDLEWI
jgi:mannose-6-phosphate isomerase-like protein (cupin superfamily)